MKKILKRMTGRTTTKNRKNSLSGDEFFAKVQQKAFELYEKRGFTSGNEWSDWFEAEKLVKSGKF